MKLDDATQRVAEQLARAVVIFDTSLNVIAFSVHDGEVDRGRLSIILNRRASPVAVEMINRSKARSSREPVILPPHAGVPARVLVPLRDFDRLFGYLSFAEPGDDVSEFLRDNAERLNQASAQLGTILARRSLAEDEDETARAAYMRDLLSPSPELNEGAADAVSAAGLISSSDRYTAVVVRRRSPRTIDHARADIDLERILHDVVRSSKYQAYGARVAALGVAILPGIIDVELVDRALGGVLGRSFAVGIGDGRGTLAEIGSSFREARIASEAAVRLADTAVPRTMWAELGLDRLLVQLPLDELRRADLPDGVIRLLDAHAGIDLARTIDSYLACGCDAQKTASVLHIHRSTLYYRLDKFRELTDIDLSDGNARRELHTGLRVARLAGFWAG